MRHERVKKSFEQGNPLDKQIKWSFEQVVINMKHKHEWYLQQLKWAFEQRKHSFEQVKSSFEQVTINVKQKHVWDMNK